MINQSRDFWRLHVNKSLEENETTADACINRWLSVMDKDFFNDYLKKKVNGCIIVLLYYLYSS